MCIRVYVCIFLVSFYCFKLLFFFLFLPFIYLRFYFLSANTYCTIIYHAYIINIYTIIIFVLFPQYTCVYYIRAACVLDEWNQSQSCVELCSENNDDDHELAQRRSYSSSAGSILRRRHKEATKGWFLSDKLPSTLLYFGTKYIYTHIRILKERERYFYIYGECCSSKNNGRPVWCLWE